MSEFLLVLTNLGLLIASMAMAFAILPQLTVKTRSLTLTTYSGMAFYILNGLQYADVTVGVLFGKLANVSTTWHLLTIRILMAIALIIFVGCRYVDLPTWRRIMDLSSKNRDS